MHNFTPGSALLGGVLIGVAASLLLVGNGRIAGISGIVSGLLLGDRGQFAGRALFVLGLLAAGFAATRLAPGSIASSPRSLPTLIIAGLFVGAGTRLGNGCTSGHGVCGLSRFSARALVATITFMLTAMLTVRVFTLLGGVP